MRSAAPNEIPEPPARIASKGVSFIPVTAPPDTPPLPRSRPEMQGIPASALLSFLEKADATVGTVTSFMVLRHGMVVGEAWWTPYAPGIPQELFSLSKIFTSAAVGLALNEGRFGIDDSVAAFFPEKLPAESSRFLTGMRIRQLLTMTTGHNDNLTSKLNDPAFGRDWLKAFFHQPVPHKPGTHFVYNGGASFVLAAIVEKVTGQSLVDYLFPRLFEPLGIPRPRWSENPQGITIGAWGLSLTTESVARFGQLCLQRGRWNGREILPAPWIDAATQRQTPTGYNPNSDWAQGYGYHFWMCRFGAYRGDGAFGQFCIVMPEQDAVVVSTSGVEDLRPVINLIWEELLPNMHDAPVPREDASWSRFTESASALEISSPRTPGAAGPIPGRSGTHRFTFPENAKGLRTVAFEFDASPIRFAIEDGSGAHRFNAGAGLWIRAHSGYRNRDGARRPIAVSGAWTEPDTYTARICFCGSPYIDDLVFRFVDDRLHFTSTSNVAAKRRNLPRIIGTANIPPS